MWYNIPKEIGISNCIVHLNLLLVQKLESIMVMIMLPECVSVCECMQVCMCDLVCCLHTIIIKLYPFSLMQHGYNVSWRGKGGRSPLLELESPCADVTRRADSAWSGYQAHLTRTHGIIHIM